MGIESKIPEEKTYPPEDLIYPSHPNETKTKPPTSEGPQATRHDLQLGRRGVHMISGVVAATVYNLFVTHSQAVYIVGAFVSGAYLVEQVRIHYPEISDKLLWFTNFLLRTEERLKESTMIPYAMGVLLVILTFPQPAAVIAIYALGIADPLSAIVGIKWGQHQTVGRKSLEGSAAFFISTTLITFFVLTNHIGGFTWRVIWASVFVGLTSAALELIPLRIDDNLTIPIMVGVLVSLICLFMGIPL